MADWLAEAAKGRLGSHVYRQLPAREDVVSAAKNSAHTIPSAVREILDSITRMPAEAAGGRFFDPSEVTPYAANLASLAYGAGSTGSGTVGMGASGAAEGAAKRVRPRAPELPPGHNPLFDIGSGSLHPEVEDSLIQYRRALGRIHALNDPSRPVTAKEAIAGARDVYAGKDPLYAAAERTGLDVSDTARIDRALDQGYLYPGYHATRGEDFSKWDLSRSTDTFPAIHIADDLTVPHMILKYDSPKEGYFIPPTELAKGSRIMPIRYRDTGSIHLTDTAMDWDPRRMLREIEDKYGHPVPHDLKDMEDIDRISAIRAYMDRDGLNSIQYKNTGETPYWKLENNNLEHSAMFPNPDDVRSAQAVYDPANRGTGLIMGQTGAPVSIIGAQGVTGGEEGSSDIPSVVNSIMQWLGGRAAPMAVSPG